MKKQRGMQAEEEDVNEMVVMIITDGGYHRHHGARAGFLSLSSS